MSSERVLTHPRMTGRIRPVPLQLMPTTPDAQSFSEHRTADGARIFVAHTVIDALITLESEHHPNESAGLLFGGYYTDGENKCTVVTHFEPPRDGEVIGSEAMVTITAAGAEQMQSRAHRRLLLLNAVGWGHTHPTFEAYFSGTDRREQRAWTEPGSVGIVVSGLCQPQQRFAVFVGPDSSPALERHAKREHRERAFSTAYRQGAAVFEPSAPARAAARRSGTTYPASRRTRPRTRPTILIYAVVALLMLASAAASGMALKASLDTDAKLASVRRASANAVWAATSAVRQAQSATASARRASALALGAGRAVGLAAETPTSTSDSSSRSATSSVASTDATRSFSSPPPNRPRFTEDR